MTVAVGGCKEATPYFIWGHDSDGTNAPAMRLPWMETLPETENQLLLQISHLFGVTMRRWEDATDLQSGSRKCGPICPTKQPWF